MTRLKSTFLPDQEPDLTRKDERRHAIMERVRRVLLSQDATEVLAANLEAQETMYDDLVYLDREVTRLAELLRQTRARCVHLERQLEKRGIESSAPYPGPESRYGTHHSRVKALAATRREVSRLEEIRLLDEEAAREFDSALADAFETSR